jgi:exodeoxyribonuclease V alpha subunit
LARAEEPPERRERLETLEGTTIHRLLHFQVQRGAFAYDEDYPVPVDAVIVDEVSMVDVSLMERLLAAVRRDALVVFLGDKNQLPSVEAGAVLAELIPSVGRYGFSPAVAAELAALTPGEEIPRASADSLLADRVVVLEQSNRVAGAVYHVAQRMNAGDVSVVDDLPSLPAGPLMAWPTDEPSCVRLSGPLGDSRLLQDTVESWVERHWVAPRGEPLLRELLSAAQAAVDRTDPEEEVPLRALLDRYSRGCILAALRRGAHGVEGLNQMLAGWLRRRLEPSAARTSLFAGAPVLVTRNTPGMGLFNGDHGVAVRRPDGRLVVLFRRGGEVLRVPASLLPPHELAFALTVHKSQGSEYDNVLLVLPSTGAHQLLTREIVYTAITRSRGMVAIWSFPQVLAEAVLRRIRRSSALGLWPEPEP